MGTVREFLGPKSKYEKSIPYTYEARVRFIDNQPDYNSYLADTICVLVDRLNTLEVSPADVDIYEIFQGDEKLLGIDFCISADGKWLSREELCQSFKEHYPGHIYEGGCSFEDRDDDVAGP